MTFPSLQSVVETVHQRAPEVVAQLGALRAADAGMVGARLSPLNNPYLEVFGDRRVSGQTGLAIQANLWIPIELSGQRGWRVGESEALSTWQQAGLDAARANAGGRAVVAYGAVMVAVERRRFLSAVLATANDEAAYYEGRLKEGDATLRDAKLAAVEVARNRVALGEAQADLARALAQLAALMGLPSLSEPRESLPGPSAVSWSEVSSQAHELAARSPMVLASAREASYFEQVRGRQAKEAHPPVNFIFSGARGELGDARVGGGLAWSLPSFRRNQGEQARAQAEQNRALQEQQINQVRTSAQLRGIADEREHVEAALRELREHGEPAAQAALDASLAVHQAGKGDLLFILSARRDLAVMKGSSLLLVARQWSLLADYVVLTGKAP